MHYGHSIARGELPQEARLDEVWFVPAAVPPHKRDKTLSSDKHRIEMLRLAIGGHEAFAVSTIEIDRGGVTYTYETLEADHAQRPATSCFS